MAEEVTWLTTSEVAELLRVSVATIHDWRTNKIGPRAYRVGRRLLWRRGEVEEWVLSRGDSAPTGEPAVAAR
jgi:excisionase family DNA binding protein